MTSNRRALLAAMGLTVRTACTAFALVGATGCVVGNDSDPPVLAVDLYWESQRFGDTCTTADVSSMDYHLLKASDKSVIKEELDRDCANGFEFSGVKLGDYIIEVTGYDADHNAAWTGECDLHLDRFDNLYPCDVSKTSS